MDLLTQLPQSWLPVLDAAAKATVILLAASCVVVALRRSSAATRHVVWTSALLAALALPMLALALPRWEAPVMTLPQASTPPATATAIQARAEAVTVERAPGDAAASLTTRPSPGAPSARASISWPAVAAGVWIVGTALILGRLLLGIVLVQRMSRRARIASDARWLPLARDLAADLGVSRVTFRRGPAGTMPMAWGVFRPAVLMPEDADAWPEERLRIVLLHELAHVKRADCLTHMLAQAACALYWMNPLTWIAARGARTERERACDDLVLAHGTPGADYADQLLEIARTLDHDRPAPAIAGASLAMAYRSQLEGRLMSILDPTVRRSGMSRPRAAAFTALGLAFAASLATIQTWAFEDEAMLPKTSRPAAPAPKPLAAPVPQAARSAAVSEQGAVETQDPQVIRRAVHEAVERATKDVDRGLISGLVAGVAGGIAEGVAAGIGEGVQQAAVASGSRSEADPKLVAALMGALKDSDREVRETAMQALVRMRAPGMVDPLMAALKDASPDVREQAAFGLGQLRDKRAVAPLTAALRDEDADVREGAAFALGQLRDTSAVPGLIAALKDENASVREQAAFALGQLRARDAVDPLIATLGDENRSVREQAAFALGQIGDNRAADALIALLKDADAQVRQQAAFALSQLR
jgi:beta-lactamase regulating signal transducer with metallopeptidase domain